jgi:DNA end-binding protein Ku
MDGTLLLETLHYPDEIREREMTAPHVLVNDRELAVASTLVDALAEPFDPSKYRDHYREALLELIEAKTEGRKVVVPQGGTAEPVTDLMAALRASIEAAKQRKGGSHEAARAADEEAPKRNGKAKARPARRRKAA